MVTTEDRNALRNIAHQAIGHGIELGHLPADFPPDLPDSLKTPGASFVTLKRNGQLRGCIGHLHADQPLGGDVAENAFAAAFKDPRFPPLAREELDDLELHISVLGPMEEIHFDDPETLLAQLSPGVHGIYLEGGRRHATFLPAVWATLPGPHDFLGALLRKGGWRLERWPDDLQGWRYTAEEF